jgi:hypothetical protein
MTISISGSHRLAFAADFGPAATPPITTSLFFIFVPSPPLDLSWNNSYFKFEKTVIQEEKGGAGMINLEVKTKLSEKELGERLKKFFGKGGLGLALCDDNPQCLSFEGGGGYVTANISHEEGKTRITLVSQEWEHQVKEFAAGLP